MTREFKVPVQAPSIIKAGGTSSQYLMADGSVSTDTASTNVLYVSKNGNDSNNGTTLNKSFLTIKAALSVATDGTTVFVKSGDYTEANPVTIPTGVSVVGDSLRAVTIRPANTSSHIFYVNNDYERHTGHNRILDSFSYFSFLLFSQLS